jgi:hypothetical protein
MAMTLFLRSRHYANIEQNFMPNNSQSDRHHLASKLEKVIAVGDTLHGKTITVRLVPEES